MSYCKSKNISLFCFLKLNRNDAYSFHKQISPDCIISYDVIDVEKFSLGCCGDFYHILIYFWERFDSEFKRKLNKIPKASDDELFLQNLREGEQKIDKISIDYISQLSKVKDNIGRYECDILSFTCFLFFFMSVKDVDIFLWTYWIVYNLYEITPDHASLANLVDILWGKKAVYKFKRKKFKLIAEKSLKLLHHDDLFPNKIKRQDIKLGGPWTYPINQMRKCLIRNFLGNSTWQRFKTAFQIACVDFNRSYSLLCDHHTLSVVEKEMYSKIDGEYLIHGDRKVFRRNLRLFIRLIKSYQMLPLDDEYSKSLTAHHPLSRSHGSSVDYSTMSNSQLVTSNWSRLVIKPVVLIKNILLQSGGRRNKVTFGRSESNRLNSFSKKSILMSNKMDKSFILTSSQSSLSLASEVHNKPSVDVLRPLRYGVNYIDDTLIKPLLNALNQNEKKKINVSKEEQELYEMEKLQQDLIPLEVKYKDSLTESLHHIYRNTNTAKERTLERLVLCTEELESGEELWENFSEDGNIHDDEIIVSKELEPDENGVEEDEWVDDDGEDGVISISKTADDEGVDDNAIVNRDRVDKGSDQPEVDNNDEFTPR